MGTMYSHIHDLLHGASWEIFFDILGSLAGLEPLIPLLFVAQPIVGAIALISVGVSVSDHVDPRSPFYQILESVVFDPESSALVTPAICIPQFQS